MKAVSGRDSARGRFRSWLEGSPDDTILTWTYRSLLVMTLVALAMDFVQLSNQTPAALPVSPAGNPDVITEVQPFLPSSRETEQGDPQPPSPSDRSALLKPMSIELAEDGRLMLTGTITPGTAARLAAEIDKRGSYVKTAVLNSPGGSVRDAIAMARLLRDRKIDTAVEAGSYCASSCPLVFAGGIKRLAHPTATIGVHQIFSGGRVGGSGQLTTDSVQRISADCQRLIVDMGVDPMLWIHAMETPRTELFYLNRTEVIKYKLGTMISGK